MLSAILAAATLIAGCDLESPSGQPGCTREAVDALPMNHIQAIGSHNSYKQAIGPGAMAILRSANPNQGLALDYSHPPLIDQLNAGARQLEIDILSDPEGGRYASPLALKMVPGDPPFDVTPLKGKGLKVLHVPDIDFRSSCSLFTTCLSEVRAWSLAHPDHVPLLLMINLKEGPGIPGGTSSPRFDVPAFDQMDVEIRSVFPESAIISPDSVQGKYPTLREAVGAGAWPRLKAARGKVIFALDAGKEAVAIYRGERKSLEGRVLFINTDASSPAAGYSTLNEPETLSAEIAKALAAGVIVRTRADADTVEARKGDRSRQAAAFASGAQYISTDYMKPDLRLGDYEAHLPGGGVARLNPVTSK